MTHRPAFPVRFLTAFPADRLRSFPTDRLRFGWLVALAIGLILPASAPAAEPSPESDSPPRCVVRPGDAHDFVLDVDGVNRLKWHFAPSFPRPFFYPVIGPSGTSLTRMGHPGAPDHDHHRSIWFAHNKVDGFNFWSEHGGTAVRQDQWLALEDCDDHAAFAVRLGWFDPEGTRLMEQQLITRWTPLENDQALLEIQTTFRPAEGREQVTLQKTNYGLLAVRVSKSLSAAFGRGTLTADDGSQGEPAIFGKPHRWVDYSGASAAGPPEQRRWVQEGITYFDHPNNVGFPNAWHVRSDGWLCASPCYHEDILVREDQPLELRYLLFLHAGAYDAQEAEQQFQAFAQRPAMLVRKSSTPHTRFEIVPENQTAAADAE
ncbi:DUF6807 domain-containing protein [Roseimaritima sediminicola]|uniref:DUF6807 domain-containing protein n=1 Tax=Roseimaritima sediminicola TaxID=2662066 RepID=UPI0012982837|nr:PmoA family protein [Roseimaritima sediminicola]